MPAEDDWVDDELNRPSPWYPAAPVPAHERTWRHPSEMGMISVAEETPAHSPSRMLLIATGVCGLAFALVLGRVLISGTSIDADTSVNDASQRAPLPLLSNETLLPAVGFSTRVVPSNPDTAVSSIVSPRSSNTLVDLAPLTLRPSTGGEDPPVEPPVTTDTSLAPSAAAAGESGTRWALVWEDQFHALTTARGTRPGASLRVRLSYGTVADATVIRVDDQGLAVLELASGASSNGDGVPVGASTLNVTVVNRSILPVMDSPELHESVTVLTLDGNGAAFDIGDDGRLLPTGVRGEAPDATEAAPVVDDDGNVVGLCTWLRGEPFVVTLDAATVLVRENIGWFGVRVGMDPASGMVRAEAVVDGSPAELAGLNPLDMLSTFNGAAITSVDQLIEIIRRMEPGDEAVIGYIPHDVPDALSNEPPPTRLATEVGPATQPPASATGSEGGSEPATTEDARRRSVEGGANLVTAVVSLGSLADAPDAAPSLG